MTQKLREKALHYHCYPQPGKLQTRATKILNSPSDLALAYSPGVAYACEAIVDNAASSYDYSAKGNLVGVISNGSAVLGLGNIGALASKPVMEGKAVLFKQFAGVDVFDIEINESDPNRLVEIIASLEPTFGAINLEDIKSPECFEVERQLQERVDIPVFHDDQHGTAITVAAGILNGLKLANKSIESVRLVASGAGAAALASLDLLVSLGMRRDNIVVTDIAGVLFEGRQHHINVYNSRYATNTKARSLQEVVEGADIFLGLSAPGVLSPAMVKTMAPQPLIFALANPRPEILPEVAKTARADAIIATGRSDYPNQVNNLLCFPFIFRGALDVAATEINDEMKIACVHALMQLAQDDVCQPVVDIYPNESLRFGNDYIVPKPFDPRLITAISPAVAIAAMESGVARRPLKDLSGYKEKLQQNSNSGVNLK